MSKKNKILLTVFLILIVIILIFLVVCLNRDGKEDNLEEYMPMEEADIELLKDKIEVYEDVNLSDVVKLSNNAKIINDYKIDTNELGKVKLYVKYIENDEEKKKYVSVDVVDSAAPYINIGDHYGHIINTNFTFDKDVLCADNYDKKITCEIVGDYDLTKLGENKVKVVAKDSSGNVTEKQISLNVIEKSKVTAETKYKKLEDIKNEKPDNASILIDVSKWQGDIDWNKVKNSGIDYAMIRLGTQEAVDKGSVVDSYFIQNIKNAQENGIKVGVYYFSYANDIDDAREQADWVLEQLKDYKLELPVAFDWECWKYYNDFNINIHDLNEIANTFLNTISKAGYDTANYGSKNYQEYVWNLKNHKTWVAHYTDKTDYSKSYIMWQFTSTGSIPGINSAVDVNYYYK